MSLPIPAAISALLPSLSRLARRLPQALSRLRLGVRRPQGRAGLRLAAPARAVGAGAALGVALALVGAPLAAGAVALLPGTTEVLSGTSLAEAPDLAGTVLANTTRPFEVVQTAGPPGSATGVRITGTLQDGVLRSSRADVLYFEARLLDVVVQAVEPSEGGLVPGSVPVPLTVTRTGLGEVFTSADFRLDSPGDFRPASATRGLDEVSFRFPFIVDGLTLADGEAIELGDSPLFHVGTDADAFAETATATVAMDPVPFGPGGLTGPATDALPAFAPATATVPEPGLAGLLAAALAAAVLARRAER